MVKQRHNQAGYSIVAAAYAAARSIADSLGLGAAVVTIMDRAYSLNSEVLPRSEFDANFEASLKLMDTFKGVISGVLNGEGKNVEVLYDQRFSTNQLPRGAKKGEEPNGVYKNGCDFYPGAQNRVVKYSEFAAATEYEEEDVHVPAYTPIIEGQIGGIFHVLMAEGASHTRYLYGTYDGKNGQIRVFSTEPRVKPESELIEPEEIDTDAAEERQSGDESLDFCLRSPDGTLEQLVFAQTTPTIDGRPASPIAFFHALKIAVCVEELYRTRGELRVPESWIVARTSTTIRIALDVVLELRTTSWILEQSVDQFYLDMAAQNAYVASVFKDFTASEEALYVRNKAGQLAIISANSGTVGCFAICLAYLWSFHQMNPTFAGFTSAFRELLDTGAIEISSDATISGTGADGFVRLGKRQTIMLNSADQAENEEAYGALQQDEFFILGLDRREVDSQPGAPDHYIVCQKRGNTVVVVYDPYRRGTPYRAGAIIALGGRDMQAERILDKNGSPVTGDALTVVLRGGSDEESK